MGILALFGRLNSGQIILNSLGFNLTWNLGYFLCAFLVLRGPDSRFFDDYQISCVYLFAGCYAAAVGQILPRPVASSIPQFVSSINSSLTGQLGSFFLFLGFCATTTLYSVKYTLGSAEATRALIWQEAFISTFIALSASVISAYACSVLLNPTYRFGIRTSLIGTLAGAILYGPVAGTCVNIGAAIACGLLAGGVSALYFERVFWRSNVDGLRDSLGTTGILGVAFLGTFLVAPTVIKTYYNYSIDLPTLYPQNEPTTTYFITSQDSAGWALVYVGISAAIGILAGLLIGLLMSILSRPETRYYEDVEIFKAGAYGLREPFTVMSMAESGFISTQELAR